jgi:hypothetical protein
MEVASFNEFQGNAPCCSGGNHMNNLSRRQVLAGTAATLVASPFIMRRPAHAA